MKRPRRYLKRLYVDLDNYKATFEDMEFTVNVENLKNYVAQRTTVE